MIKRVAAYCRVSTKHEEQMPSIEAQREYYSKLITNTPNWELVGIYCDIASGRSNKKLIQWSKLMEECSAGNVDLILMKSISRMGRNSLEVIKTCRLLKELGVDVYFETENIRLRDTMSDLMIEVYAALKQQESYELSQIITWGIRHGFRSGNSKFINRPCYGYRKDEHGNLVIIEDEARVVRMIFAWKAEGKSLRGISDELFALGINSPRGNARWYPETINKVLNNEKYSGHVMLQKTFVKEFLTGKQVINRGELDRYLVENNHDAIIE